VGRISSVTRQRHIGEKRYKTLDIVSTLFIARVLPSWNNINFSVAESCESNFCHVDVSTQYLSDASAVITTLTATTSG
jgi:hypothetical protein